MTKPLLLTMGDPTGVGPEIIVEALRQNGFDGVSHPLVVAGDLAIMKRAAQVCRSDFVWRSGSQIPLASGEMIISGHTLPLCELSQLEPNGQRFGRPDLQSGKAMSGYISWACDQCLTGNAAGMITAPINKQALQLAGIHFPGHTEMLASQCGVEDVVMMLAGERLKVSLVTTHCAFHKVPEKLTIERILSSIRITAAALCHQFGLRRPRLAVLALNPHAGEDGLFGDEEKHIIEPAIKAARDSGIEASGPHSADTLFWFATQGHFDAVVCMYHDQGLIPLKLLHFEDGVNITLGLPFIRTSVDHGTAYDLAGTGQANPASLIAATKMADQMSKTE